MNRELGYVLFNNHKHKVMSFFIGPVKYPQNFLYFIINKIENKKVKI